MPAPRCASCDTRLGWRAAWCPRCGAPAPGSAAATGALGRAGVGPDLGVHAVDDPLMGDDGAEVVLGSGRGVRGAVGVAVAAAALLAVGVAVSRDGGASSAASTTTATSSTVAATTTTERPPLTTRPAPTTAPLASVSLPAPSSGRLLIDIDGTIVMVDLSTGLPTELEGQLELYGGNSVVQLGDALVGNVNGSLRALPVDGAPSRPFSSEAFRIFGSPGDVGSAWVWEGGPTPSVRRVSARGDGLSPSIDLPLGTYPLTLVDGRIVIAGGGRTFSWDPLTGEVDPVADVVANAVDGDWGIAAACDDDAVCSSVLVDLAGGEVVPLADLRLPEYLQAFAVSPDGRYVATAPFDQSSREFEVLTLYDRADGSRRTLRGDDLAIPDARGGPSFDSASFSGDGRQLWFVGRGSLFVWPVDQDVPQRVTIRDGWVNALTVVPVS